MAFIFPISFNMFLMYFICSLFTAVISSFTNLLSLIIPIELDLFVMVSPSWMINATITNSGTPFILLKSQNGKIQLSGLIKQILFCLLYIYLLIFVSVFKVPISFLSNFVFRHGGLVLQNYVSNPLFCVSSSQVS